MTKQTAANERLVDPALFVSRFALALLGVFLAACSPSSNDVLGPGSGAVLIEKAQPSKTTHPIEIPANHFALLRLDAPGSEVRASLLADNHQELAAVKHLYLRSAPMFFCVDPGVTKSAIELEIEILNSTHEFPVALESHFLDTATPTSDRLIQGLGFLCEGVLENSSEDAQAWASQLDSLQQAEEILLSAGQAELSQWAGYFHAHAYYAPLYDYRAAIEKAQQLASGLDANSQPLLSLLTYQLLGQALLEQDENDTPEQSAEQLLRSQDELRKAINLAKQLGNRYEESWAVNNQGIAYFYQDQLTKSIPKYLQAIGIIESLGDSFLLNLYSQNLALAQDRAGASRQALETLQDIHAKLAGLDSGPYANLNLIEQGRLFNKLHLYPDAIRVLTQALATEPASADTESTGRINTFLGVAYQQLGQVERSNEYLAKAITDMQQANYANGLRDGYEILASNHRQLQDFTRMRQYRALQGQHLSNDHNRASWYYQQSYDASSAGDLDAALEFIRQSLAAEELSELDYLSSLGQLRSCVIQLQKGLDDSCDRDASRGAVEALLAQGNPRRTFEGRLMWAEILALSGNPAEALAVTTDLIEQISDYRQLLPGVLGSWYWDSRAELFHFHMGLVLALTEDDPSATKALLALRSLQNVNAHMPGSRESAEHQSADSMQIRELLRELDRADLEGRRLELATAIDQVWFGKAGVSKSSNPAGNSGAAEPVPGLAGTELPQQIPANATLLAYYWSGEDLHAWTGTATGLLHQQLEVPEDFAELMQLTRRELRVVNSNRLDAYLNRLGQILIKPLQARLQDRILFMASGAVASIPLEAIQVDGQPIYQQYEVANLMSLDALTALQADAGSPEDSWKIFIAGDPQFPVGGLATLDGASQELLDLQDSFTGQSVSVAGGSDLKSEAFATPAFREADIVHIASHGLINRQWPELSQIVLTSTGSEPEYLMPADLEKKSIAADLVVLSACDMAGETRFEFDTGLGFVSEFMQAGASSVVASQWPVADQLTAQFMREFYAAKLSGQDNVSALTKAKRKMINAAHRGGVYQQVAFQLYLR